MGLRSDGGMMTLLPHSKHPDSTDSSCCLTPYGLVSGVSDLFFPFFMANGSFLVAIFT